MAYKGDPGSFPVQWHLGLRGGLTVFSLCKGSNRGRYGARAVLAHTPTRGVVALHSVSLEFSRLSVLRRDLGQLLFPFPRHTASSLPECVCSPDSKWPQERRKERSVIPPDGVSGLSSGETGLERPHTETAGPALSARPATEAAARTTCVTEVGNDLKTVTHRTAYVKWEKWTVEFKAPPPLPANVSVALSTPLSPLPPSALCT